MPPGPLPCCGDGHPAEQHTEVHPPDFNVSGFFQ